MLGPLISPNISGTGEGTKLKFCKWIESKGPDTEHKMQNWSKRVVAYSTSRARDLLNKQATEALRNGNIPESITFDFQQGYRMWTWFVNFSGKKKQKINFKNWTSI